MPNKKGDRPRGRSPTQPAGLARAAPSLRIFALTEGGSSFCSWEHSVRRATASIELKVVTDKGRCVVASCPLAPMATDASALLIPPPRCKKAQNADPSVKRARRATFPCFCSYVANAGSASVTFARNCASCAAEVFGADKGVVVAGGEGVVVAADTAGPPAATMADEMAHQRQADAMNRRGFHPAAATCAALQILSHLSLRQTEHPLRGCRHLHVQFSRARVTTVTSSSPSP
jgi:hypothetical protein